MFAVTTKTTTAAMLTTGDDDYDGNRETEQRGKTSSCTWNADIEKVQIFQLILCQSCVTHTVESM